MLRFSGSKQVPVTVCLMDTGILSSSAAAKRVVAGVNLSGEGDAADVFAKTNGHGTQAAETILDECPDAQLAILRVMDDNGWLRTMESVETAFAWVLARANELGPAVICAAFGDMFHYRSDEIFRDTGLLGLISRLRSAGVLSVTAAGNMYPRFRVAQPQGMAWPAILRETVSVGALTNESPRNGIANVEWSSQRLHLSFGTGCATSLFALPGAPGDTSGAAARVAGRLARLRQVHPRATADELFEVLIAEAGEVQDAVTGLTWSALLPQQRSVASPNC